tara:strand:- start:3430 stop:4929 length:1500 start_codon:yes stop_codon:yes gene_type:complete
MLKTLYIKLIFAFFLVVLLLAGSLFNLTGKPAVWFDEGIFLHTSRVLSDEGFFGVQIEPSKITDASIITVGYPLLVPIAAVTKLFGPSIFYSRMVMVLFILGFALCFFLLTRKLYGTSFAFVSTFLLASFAPLYGIGKSVIGEVPGLFFMTFGLLFMRMFETSKQNSSNLTKKKYLYVLLAGIGFGLATSTKPVFLVLAGAILIGVILRIRFWKLRLYELLIGMFGFVMPLLLWVHTQFGGALSISKILEFYANPYVLPSDTIVNLIKTNTLRFFTESTPIHFAILLIVSAAFLFIKFRSKEKVCTSEITVFIFVVLVLASYLRTPGWYRYFFLAHVMLFIFLPVAFARFESIIVNRLRIPFGRIRKKDRLGFASFAVLVLIIVVQLVHFYKEERGYVPDSTALARVHLSTISQESNVIFYNASELAYLYPHKNYSQYIGINEGLKMGEASLVKIKKGEFDILVIPTTYLSEDFIPRCYKLDHKAGNYSFLAKDNTICK